MFSLNEPDLNGISPSQAASVCRIPPPFPYPGWCLIRRRTRIRSFPVVQAIHQPSTDPKSLSRRHQQCQRRPRFGLVAAIYRLLRCFGPLLWRLYQPCAYLAHPRGSWTLLMLSAFRSIGMVPASTTSRTLSSRPTASSPNGTLSYLNLLLIMRPKRPRLCVPSLRFSPPHSEQSRSFCRRSSNPPSHSSTARPMYHCISLSSPPLPRSSNNMTAVQCLRSVLARACTTTMAPSPTWGSSCCKNLEV